MEIPQTSQEYARHHLAFDPFVEVSGQPFEPSRPAVHFGMESNAQQKITAAQVSKFSTGNLETLKLEPEKAGRFTWNAGFLDLQFGPFGKPQGMEQIDLKLGCINKPKL